LDSTPFSSALFGTNEYVSQLPSPPGNDGNEEAAEPPGKDGNVGNDPSSSLLHFSGLTAGLLVGLVNPLAMLPASPMRMKPNTSLLPRLLVLRLLDRERYRGSFMTRTNSFHFSSFKWALPEVWATRNSSMACCCKMLSLSSEEAEARRVSIVSRTGCRVGLGGLRLRERERRGEGGWSAKVKEMGEVFGRGLFIVICLVWMATLCEDVHGSFID
jgi:hypothetical protein